MQIYNLRAEQPNLVRVINIAAHDHHSICVRSEQAKLLVEYIPIRLSLVKELDREEALTILYAVYKGCHIIEGWMGPFEPAADLIGFTSEGKPKIWVNSAFQLNYPEIKSQSFFTDQPERVSKIFRFIERKVKG